MRYLFDMSDAELDREYEKYSDRLYNDYYHIGEPDPCCKNCSHWYDGICSKLEAELTDSEAAEMDETEDYSAIEKAEDDYCDNWDPKADDYPDFLEDDR